MTILFIGMALIAFPVIYLLLKKANQGDSNGIKAFIIDFGTLFITIIGILCLIYFAESPWTLNRIMDKYERDEVVKEYTIIKNDTTYRWIYIYPENR